MGPQYPFKAIAAMALNRVIGSGNSIPWHLPEDFKWFKQTTSGHVIVMGRKTYESIGRPLPNRTTVVLTRQLWDPHLPTVRVITSLEQLVELPGEYGQWQMADGKWQRGEGGREIFICGGADLYRQTLGFCSDLYLTLVKREVSGDASFPEFESKFQLTAELRDTPDFKILHYTRTPRPGEAL